MSTRARGVLTQVHLHAVDGAWVEVLCDDGARAIYAVDSTPESLAFWFESRERIAVVDVDGTLFVRHPRSLGV